MSDYDDIGRLSDGGSHATHQPKPDLGLLVVPVSSNGAVHVTAPRRRFSWTLAALVGIVALGALLRVWNIDALGFNGDETIYAGQGASIANVPELAQLFPTFRAHPLLFQTLLAGGYDAGLGAPFERLFAAAFGLGTIMVTFSLGRLMWGRTVGLIAALLIAVMPYTVVVSRQVLLDGPMAFFAVLTLYCAARFALSGRQGWLNATAACLGLTIITKETSILYSVALCVFIALCPQLGVRLRQLVRAAAVAALVVLPFPLALAIGGGGNTGNHYLSWQLFRRANHNWAFYPSVLPAAIGPLVLVLAAFALYKLRHERSWRQTLLLCWILVPALFFELWPVKGYQYMIGAAPALAILGALGLTACAGTLMRAGDRRRSGQATAGRPLAGSNRERALVAGLTAAVALSLLVPTLAKVRAASEPVRVDSLAGTGGVPGGREAGTWVRAHVPTGARLLTVGPSMANIMQYYGRRKAFGLSVSPNPLNRNPSYQPIVNPDKSIRHGDLQYLVWDAFSADRSPFFSRALIRYADRYSGRVAHKETRLVRTPSGATVRKPVILIYEVRP